MHYYLGEIWIQYPTRFWRKAYSRKLQTVLIRADDKTHAYNKLSLYTDKVRNDIRLAETSHTKLKGVVLEAI